MYEGHVFLCDAGSVKDCVKRRLFTCTGEKVQIVSQMELGSIVFLLNMDSNTLVGPFTVSGSSETDLKSGAWRDFTETRTNAGIRVEWENLHELKNAQDIFPFLKDINVCKLSHFQTQDLLNALKDAPSFNKK
ncbi:MAG TPA: hypothetical protein VMT42_04965 [candidate division Zixibacteria bacterium]|nr:hypothetical protein [candidate division Zixibacteria bacterium]